MILIHMPLILNDIIQYIALVLNRSLYTNLFAPAIVPSWAECTSGSTQAGRHVKPPSESMGGVVWGEVNALMGKFPYCI